MKAKIQIILSFLFIILPLYAGHPNLLLTQKGVDEIRTTGQTVPLFSRSLNEVKLQLEQTINQPMEVPVPKDAGGGYTHEVHKKNYLDMANAGTLYQISGEEKYARFIREMLLRYADLYPTLGLHPVQKSNYRGKLFWQGLNECVWLVHAAQAYDCVYNYLSIKERQKIEGKLLRPMCDFISFDNMSTFNKIHNHGTWAVAAVGMAGYAMGDKDLTEKALRGYYKDGKGGFLQQIEQLFSPDGYFTEGPYYQRYSLQPFVMFAQVIANNEPELDIFAYHNGMILKAVDVVFQLMEPNGQIFYLNDALDKTWHTTELVYAIDIAYGVQPDRKELLSIAKEQNRVILTEAGLKVAKDVDKGEARTYLRKSLLLRDGPEGKDGAIALLRSGNNPETTALMKYTSHGLSHGHFDKLTIAFYDNGKEILKDYGAARFLNIEPKNGGHYLKENNTFAKQSIAHNTVVIDSASHYKGEMRISENYSPQHLFFVEKEHLKAAGAEDSTAYPGIRLNRKIALVESKEMEHPILIDVYTVDAPEAHQLDLPFYFMGHLIATNFSYKAHTQSRHTFGTDHGYQHIWVEAEGKSEKPLASLTFLNENRFYTITAAVNPDTELYINRIGANDPEFNLKNNPCWVLRDKNCCQRTYLNVVEPHGDFNPVLEYTKTPYSAIKELELVENTRTKAVVRITLHTGKQLTVEIGPSN